MLNIDHVKHIMSWLRGEEVRLDCIAVKCQDGEMTVCRLSLGLLLPFLRELEEFWNPNFDPVIVLPEENVTKFKSSLTNFLTLNEEADPSPTDRESLFPTKKVQTLLPLQDEEGSEQSVMLIEEVTCEPVIYQDLLDAQDPGNIEEAVSGETESESVEYNTVVLKDIADLDENQTLIENVIECDFVEDDQRDSFSYSQDVYSNQEGFTIEYINTEESKSPLKSKITTGTKDGSDSEKRYAGCPVCGSMISRYNMVQHLNTHNKRFSCTVCLQNFAMKKNKIAHERNSHGLHKNQDAISQNSLLACDECDKVFLAKYHLKTHKSTHTNKKLFPCETCGKHYFSKSNLKSHMRIHDGNNKVFNCPYDSNCNKKFSHRSEVKQHRVVHTKVKDYRCIHCGNLYSRYPSLWKHMRKCTFNPHLHNTIESQQTTPYQEDEDVDEMTSMQEQDQQQKNETESGDENKTNSEHSGNSSDKSLQHRKSNIQHIQSIGVEIQEPSGEISQFDTVLLFET